MLLPVELPVVQAPMAGGPSTPALAAAAAGAGALGFVAFGYLSPAAAHDALAATRALTGAPFGVNIFVPSPASADQAAISAYAQRLAGEAERLGVALGEPRHDDDAYAEKLTIAAGAALVAFTFGCPSTGDIEALHRAGSQVAVTVTSPAEALQAQEAGTDALVVQGTEAGGHQGMFVDDGPNSTPLVDALAAVRGVTRLPMIAAGGIMTGADLAAVLAAGAIAGQVGTALLCTPEAGTSDVHRRALLDRRYDGTVVTRAFSGRYARGLANRFATVYSDGAPAAYPDVHHLTRPLRAAATRAGDADVPNLWAGTGWRHVTAEPAGDVIRRIAADAQRLTQPGLT